TIATLFPYTTLFRSRHGAAARPVTGRRASRSRRKTITRGGPDGRSAATPDLGAGGAQGPGHRVPVRGAPRQPRPVRLRRRAAPAAPRVPRLVRLALLGAHAVVAGPDADDRPGGAGPGRADRSDL